MAIDTPDCRFGKSEIFSIPGLDVTSDYRKVICPTGKCPRCASKITLARARRPARLNAARQAYSVYRREAGGKRASSRPHMRFPIVRAFKAALARSIGDAVLA